MWPEDISRSYRELLEPLQQLARKRNPGQLCIGVVTDAGMVDSLVDLGWSNVEGRKNGREVSTWMNVIRRIQSVGMNTRGRTLVRLNIWVNTAGDPICWTTPSVDRMEPRR